LSKVALLNLSNEFSVHWGVIPEQTSRAKSPRLEIENNVHNVNVAIPCLDAFICILFRGRINLLEG